jgi:penicillin amidase
VWYLTHIKVRDEDDEVNAPLNVSGVSLPGIPSIVIGHNEHIAWGMTTTYFDFTDVYLDELTPDGNGVIFQGEEVPFIRRDDRFGLSGMPDETYETLYVPHHGPVIAIDEERGVVMTMRWTGQDADTDFNFLLELARASTVNEAKEAIKSVTSIGQNFVIADDQGHIGWFPYNRLPSRPWASPELDPAFPLPGDGSAEWGEPIPYEELPQLYDPDEGFVVTANHDMTGAFADGDLTNDAQEDGPARAMQEDPDEGYRYSQATRLVARDEPHDRDSLEAAIHDRESLLARRLLPALIIAVDISALSESGQRLLGVLSGWGDGPKGYDCPAGVSLELLDRATPSEDPQERSDFAGCFAFHVLYAYLIEQVFDDEIAAITDREFKANREAISRLIARPEILYGGVSYWDDVSTPTEEDASLTIALAMNRAGSYFNREYGANTDEWLWGKVHTITLTAAVISAAGVKSYDHGPYPNHGGLHTVDVANPRDMHGRNFEHTSGASMRFICELTSPPRCAVEVPGGQRHHRDSPHYDDLFRRWLDRTPTMMPFSDEEIDAVVTEEINFPGDL